MADFYNVILGSFKSWEWGSVPDWFAAIGTISAVFYALFHDRKKSKLDVGYYFTVKYTDFSRDVYNYPRHSNREIEVHVIALTIANLGNVSELITKIEFQENPESNEYFEGFGLEPVIVEAGQVVHLTETGWRPDEPIHFDENYEKRFQDSKKIIRLTTRSGKVINANYIN